MSGLSTSSAQASDQASLEGSDQAALEESTAWFGRLGFRAPVGLDGLVPLGFVALLALLAVAAPLVSPHDAAEPNLTHRLEGPSAAFWLGTDDLGRDVLSRLIFGARVSLLVGLLSTAITLGIGLPLGLYCGYVLGRLNAVIMRTVDAWLAFPPILLAMVVSTVLGAGIVNISLSIALVFWPGLVRVVRAAVLSQREMQYVEAARALGGSTLYVMFRSILPNILAPLAVQTALLAAGAILLEAGLTFLGLGIRPPTPSWGGMLQEAKAYLRQDPWFGVFPGLLLLLVVLALNGVADSVARRYDRRRR